MNERPIHPFGRPPETPSSWPALSLRQPWLWAIFELGKTVENRRWNTKYRGPVWLHAAKGCTRDEASTALMWMYSRALMDWRQWPGLVAVERGGVCGVADIFDIVAPSEPAAIPWHMPEQWGFLLRNVTRIDFVPCKGALGLFRLPSDVEAQAPAALERGRAGA